MVLSRTPSPASSQRLHEINTATYLQKLSAQYGRKITLATIPDEELTRIVHYGADAVWFMGVWRRSLIAVDIALQDQPLMNEVRTILPDFQATDMTGSAYAISGYEVNDAFGGEGELLTLRARLAALNMGLILDFVPNHTAFDHKWISTRPDCYIQGNSDDLAQHASWFRECDSRIIANGRDPYYDPWPDVAQLNAFSQTYRQASIETLSYIATLCDGVRCDMAMLMLNDIFASTWGERAGAKPALDYWQEIIPAVQQQARDFVFIAESYWHTESALIDQGFDFCYDKDGYDALLSGDAQRVASHIEAATPIAGHLVHFLENHDEPRAARTFPLDQHKAAVFITVTQPGLFLQYEGQTTGYPAKIPVHLGREPLVASDQALTDYYNQLLTVEPQYTFDWHIFAQDSRVLIGRDANNDKITALVNFSDESVAVDASSLDMSESIYADITGQSDILIALPAQLTLQPWQCIIIRSATN